VVVGIPGREVRSIRDAGAVLVLRSGDGGVSAANERFWHQDSPDILEVAQPGDRFSSWLPGRPR
jgi:hypothetical protein